MNALEAAMYLYYLYVLVRSAKKGQQAEVVSLWKRDFWTEPKLLGGEGMAGAVVVCFAAAVMTVSKTALYCKSSASRLLADAMLVEANPSLAVIRAERVFLEVRKHWP